MNNKPKLTECITFDQYNRAFEFLGKLIEYADDVDAILKDVANHYDADRAYVFELAEDRKTLSNTCEWCKNGISSEKDNLQNIPYESVAIWIEEFERVGAFYISSLDKDVDENSITYKILEPQSIESLITAPIYKNKKIMGFIGVDNPKNNIDDIVILKTTANILNSEISKKISNKNDEIKKIKQANIKQDTELGEIKDIVASAEMGIWRIELVDNEEPRMYADNTMKKLLGIQKFSGSPEQVYSDWFSNITPGALSSVLNSVSKMERGHFDENTYLWKHPTKGVRYVRCGGTAKQIPGGFSLQGYHYDVDEVERKNQAQLLKLKNALDDKKEYFDTLDALGGIFYSMHTINLIDDTVIEFSAKDEVKQVVNKKDGAIEMMREIMNQVVINEYKNQALEFTDLTTISDRMKNKKILVHELVGKNTGWFMAYFITMEADEAGKPTKVIFATRVIDEEMKQKEQLIYKTQTDELTGLLNRRAYEEKIYERSGIPTENEFVYVSLDANGLKEVNDNKSHAAGDELLIGLSECMKASFGKNGEVFRTGGDEFVAILFCDMNKAKAILSEFDKLVSNWHGKIIDRLSVSYGYVDKYEFPSASTRELGAIAEQRMYDQKNDYYHKQGYDRRGQHDAHKKLCELYTKILKINITNDTFKIVNMDLSEQTSAKGYAEKISVWLKSFGTTGQVHPDDLNEYLRLTDLDYIKSYFDGNKTSLHIFYRRKCNNEFKQVMMEIVPANDYSKTNQSLFLYVKSIDK